MSSFTSVFGGDTIDPSYLAFAEYTTSVDLDLSWPLEADTDATVMAAKMSIVATAVSLSVAFPDARIVSVGRDALIKNTGSNTFAIKDAAGNTIASIASGTAWYFYLTDNTTLGGEWEVVQFGAGSSSANAASLAGAGLTAVLTRLNQDLNINPQPSDYAPSVGDLATVILGTGGVVTYTPASAVTLGNGWFVWVINGGSGTLTWAPTGGQTVDGVATKVLQPDESAIFFSDGANFWSAAYGRALSSTVSAVSINVTGQPDPMTLSANQVAAQIQDYNGTLAAALTVNYGTGVGFWFVRNNTSGAYALTLRVNGSDAGVVVAQGSYSILRSNGSTMAIAFTATSGTVTQINTTADLTGGPITTTGTLGLSDTGVVAGTYGGGLNVPQIDVSAKGRITSASNVALGTAAALNAGTAPGNVPVLNSFGLVPPESGGVPTGVPLPYIGLTAPSGYVFGSGLTIGNAASGATGRANADTVALFTLLWNSWANAQAAVSGGRGANAAADFAANKTITLPNLCGAVIAGLDNNGGVSPVGRLTTPQIAGTTPGAFGGAQTNGSTIAVSVSGTASVAGTTSGSLSVSGITGPPSGITPINGGGGNAADASHTHPVSGTTSGSLTVSGTATLSAVPGTIAIGAVGTVQPTMVMSYILKL